MRDLSESWLVEAVRRRGYRRASKALSYLVCWLVVAREIGHEPSVEEYRDWWRVSLATAYREQQSWRELWPEFRSPGDLLRAAGRDPLAVDVDGAAIFTGTPAVPFRPAPA